MTAAAYAVLLLAAVHAGLRIPAPDRPLRRCPATVAALVVVGVPTLLQLTVAPALLDHLRRDRAAIAGGQVWRLVTALVVQDGGAAGGVFNLVTLALVGAVAERVWGSARWVAVALGAGLAAELWGLVVQPVGAGNSVAVFGLAGSLLAAAVRSGPRPARAEPAARGRWAGAAAGLLVAAALLVFGDIHGGAAAVGAGLGWMLRARRDAPRRQTIRP